MRAGAAVPVGTALRRILPGAVETEEHVGPAPGGVLLPGEERAVAGAAASRRREYATVRACARVCLGRLGHPPVAVLPGAGGAPGWPAGFCGSMTHCEGYAAAAVASSTGLAGLGIDAEPDAPLPPGVLEVVSTRAERERLRALPGVVGGPCWDRLLFSAKEAVFKVWFPLAGCWLGPEDTRVVLCQDGTFAAGVPDGLTATGPPVTRLDGRWTRAGGVMLTAVALPAPRAREGSEHR